MTGYTEEECYNPHPVDTSSSSCKNIPVIIKTFFMRNVTSTVLNKWFNEVWNSGNESAIDELMTQDAEAHGILAPGQPKGPEGFKQFFHSFRNQFHNIKIDVEDVVSQDDVESARTVVHAVHTPTGKEVTFEGICMVRVEDGKIAEAWNSYDFLSMHQQLGQKLTSESPVVV